MDFGTLGVTRPEFAASEEYSELRLTTQWMAGLTT
jgi:hypothetical protein